MAQRQIVLIPGYYGSRLLDRVSNILLWLSEFTLQKPEHTLEGIRLPASDGRVVVDGILDNVAILSVLKVPIYHRLIAFLVHGMGYARNEVHALGVDFRKSLPDLLDGVKSAIDDVVSSSGQPVDLIAHSHGGLVARAYLDKFGGGKVAKLITLGTPHNGMLETFEAICQGIQFLRFDPAQLMDVARGFPSAYELLPVDKNDGYFLWNDVLSSPFDVTDWCATNAMKAMVANAASVTPRLSRNLPVPLFAIHGTRTRTTVAAEGPTNGNTGVTFDHSDGGDGSVPLASGAARGINATGGVMRLAIPFGGHAFLFDNRNAQEVIRHILREDPLPSAYFAAEWEEQMYLPNAQNRVIVQLDDFSGDPIPDATVTLTLPGRGVQDQPLQKDVANGDYVLTVDMPGAGTQVPYIINASAPTLPQPFKKSGLLVAAAN